MTLGRLYGHLSGLLGMEFDETKAQRSLWSLGHVHVIHRQIVSHLVICLQYHTLQLLDFVFRGLWEVVDYDQTSKICKDNTFF